MIILIDSGNSRIKLGLWKSADLSTPTPSKNDVISTPAFRTIVFSNCDLVALEQWINNQGVSTFDEAWGINVAGEAQSKRIEQIFFKRGCLIHWCMAQEQTERLINGYAPTAQLGPDRWASMVGLIAHAPSDHPPIILASFGTATTIDVVGPDDVFRGGSILPGPELMARALSTHTAELPFVSAPSTLFPINTTAAIATGVAAAQAGAVLRQFLVTYEHFSLVPSIYVTGGGWRRVRSEVYRLFNDATGRLLGVYRKIHALPHLSLNGIALMSHLAHSKVDQKK